MWQSYNIEQAVGRHLEFIKNVASFRTYEAIITIIAALQVKVNILAGLFNAVLSV
jgi:hypothetical protein